MVELLILFLVIAAAVGVGVFVALRLLQKHAPMQYAQGARYPVDGPSTHTRYPKYSAPYPDGQPYGPMSQNAYSRQGPWQEQGRSGVSPLMAGGMGMLGGGLLGYGLGQAMNDPDALMVDMNGVQGDFAEVGAADIYSGFGDGSNGSDFGSEF